MSEALINEVLSEYGELTQQAMAPYMRPGAPAEYLYKPMFEYPARPGKMMRPAIMIATAKAFGGRAEDVIELAASLELLHNALLIHDDIEDGSEIRRKKPALHQVYGAEIAINAGDALALASLRPLTDAIPRLGPSVGAALNLEMHRMARETAEGQAIELGWRRDGVFDLAPEDYMVMVLKKTCWLAMIYPCRAGAVTALRSSLDVNAFIRFGFFIGAAFQINDDILNIEAGLEYGKEIGGDIAEGKRTIMLIDMLHRLEGEDLKSLKNILYTPRNDLQTEQVRWASRKMKRIGALDRARSAARGMVGAGMHEFALAFKDAPDSRDKAFLQALGPWTMSRVA